MAHPNPYPKCIFCGAKADSREHAIPAWMSKRLGVKVQMDHASSGLTPRKQPVSFASHRARIFCSSCNTHFKHLEDDVIPLLVPMANGQSLALDLESRNLLALWAAKTGIALIAASTDLRDFVPPSHRHPVRYEDRPSDETWCGYFSWTGNDENIFIADGQLTPPLPKTQAWNVVFTFRRAGFKVMGFMDPVPEGWTIGAEAMPVAQVWPQQNTTLTWPGRRPIARDEFARFMAWAPLEQSRP